MVYGLPESDNPNIDIRIQEDTSKVKSIIHDELGLVDVEVDRVIRLSHGRPVPRGGRGGRTTPPPKKISGSPYFL